jgi:hypothetical protein
MRKFILLLFLFSFLTFTVKEADAQLRSTAPGMIAGLTLNANFATNDFYGTSQTHIRFPEVNDYNAMYGRGAALHLKFAFGRTRSNALTTEIEFNQMLHNNSSGETPFMMNPDPPHTFYHILSGIVGYEHRFYARCREKFTMGGGFSINRINTPSYSSLRYENDVQTKVGFQLAAGYERVLDAANKWGLRVGVKFHQLNPFDTKDDGILVNDQPKGWLNDWGRKLGVLSLNVGIMNYSGY